MPLMPIFCAFEIVDLSEDTLLPIEKFAMENLYALNSRTLSGKNDKNCHVDRLPNVLL